MESGVAEEAGRFRGPHRVMRECGQKGGVVIFHKGEKREK
jgi:hypothetical protein